MNVKSLLAPLLVGMLAASLAPVAAAQVGESCTVSSWTWHFSLRCSGLFREEVFLSWCPVHPTIDCFDAHILTCTVQTSRPIFLCPLLA